MKMRMSDPLGRASCTIDLRTEYESDCAVMTLGAGLLLLLAIGRCKDAHRLSDDQEARRRQTLSTPRHSGWSDDLGGFCCSMDANIFGDKTVVEGHRRRQYRADVFLPMLLLLITYQQLIEILPLHVIMRKRF